MNIAIPRGANLMMDFQLPFTDPPGDVVYLDMNGEELLFLRDGLAVASFTRVTDPDELKLMYFKDSWWLRFSSDSYEFLLDGLNEYELTVTDLDNNVLIEDRGTVTING